MKLSKITSLVWVLVSVVLIVTLFTVLAAPSAVCSTKIGEVTYYSEDNYTEYTFVSEIEFEGNASMTGKDYVELVFTDSSNYKILDPNSYVLDAYIIDGEEKEQIHLMNAGSRNGVVFEVPSDIAGKTMKINGTVRGENDIFEIHVSTIVLHARINTGKIPEYFWSYAVETLGDESRIVPPESTDLNTAILSYSGAWRFADELIDN